MHFLCRVTLAAVTVASAHATPLRKARSRSRYMLQAAVERERTFGTASLCPQDQKACTEPGAGGGRNIAIPFKRAVV